MNSVFGYLYGTHYKNMKFAIIFACTEKLDWYRIEHSKVPHTFSNKLISKTIFGTRRSRTHLFPGLMAASVWMPPPIVTPVLLTISRFSPLITPTVRVWSKPKGFPIAKHCWPTLRTEDWPTLIGFKRSAEASTCSKVVQQENFHKDIPTEIKGFTLLTLHGTWVCGFRVQRTSCSLNLLAIHVLYCNLLASNNGTFQIFEEYCQVCEHLKSNTTLSHKRSCFSLLSLHDGRLFYYLIF